MWEKKEKGKEGHSGMKGKKKRPPHSQGGNIICSERYTEERNESKRQREKNQRGTACRRESIILPK